MYNITYIFKQHLHVPVMAITSQTQLCPCEHAPAILRDECWDRVLWACA